VYTCCQLAAGIFVYELRTWIVNCTKAQSHSETKQSSTSAFLIFTPRGWFNPWSTAESFTLPHQLPETTGSSHAFSRSYRKLRSTHGTTTDLSEHNLTVFMPSTSGSRYHSDRPLATATSKNEYVDSDLIRSVREVYYHCRLT
jgi:hypothetical protein